MIRGRFVEVANPQDHAYLELSGSFKDRKTGHTLGTVAAYGVDKGNFNNGLYLIRLTHNRGVYVASEAAHQDVPPVPTGTGHGQLGYVGDQIPRNYSVLLTSACSPTGARLVTGPIADPQTKSNGDLVTGRLSVAESIQRQHSCKAASLQSGRMDAIVTSANLAVAGELRLNVNRTVGSSGDGVLFGSGTFTRKHAHGSQGRVSFIGAQHGSHTDGMFLVHLAKNGGLLALNTSLSWTSPTRAAGEFGSITPVRPRNTGVFAPSCA